MTRASCIVLLVSTVAVFTAAGAGAACLDDLPPKLLEDCIVVEGSGSPFPNKSYAHVDLYKEWLFEKNPQAAQAMEAANEDDKSSDRQMSVHVKNSGEPMLFPEIVIDSPITAGQGQVNPEVASSL